MNPIPHFQVHQIICIRHEDDQLFAEMIQVADQCQSCWVRPLALKVAVSSLNAASVEPIHETLGTYTLYDLRQGADLLCPITWCTAALDTDSIPVLMHFGDSKSQSEDDESTHEQLRSFIQRVCRSHIKST